MTEHNRHPVAEPEVHLIPAGFIGHVVIRHAHAEGAALERDGTARLYRIPADGVLVTQAAANYGVRPPERMAFFAVDAAGTRTPLPIDVAAARGPSILGGYQVGPDFHYFVDRPENAAKYPNPAIEAAGHRG